MFKLSLLARKHLADACTQAEEVKFRFLIIRIGLK